jgi:TRAP-type C4-dicarboxylate transport system substrate-binding protein
MMLKHCLAVSLSLAVALPALADDPIVLKAGSVAPEGTPWAEWLDGVRKRIDKEAGGRIKTKAFLSGKLGGEREMIDDTKKGTLQMFGGSIGALAAVNAPELGAFELPFIFESDAEADFVMNATRDKVAATLDKAGFVMAMWAENGWHGYGLKKRADGTVICIQKPDDLKGRKMRSQESTIHLDTYKAFGASPVEMAVPEVLAALQTGAVDGYSNTPLFSFSTSWYSGIDSYAYTKHIYQPGILVYSKKWFEGLPPDIQTILKKRDEEKSGFTLVRQLTNPLLDNLKAAGKTVCTLNADQTAVFAKQARPVWDNFAKKSKANKEMLDAILAAKKQFKK